MTRLFKYVTYKLSKCEIQVKFPNFLFEIQYAGKRPFCRYRHGSFRLVPQSSQQGCSFQSTLASMLSLRRQKNHKFFIFLSGQDIIWSRSSHGHELKGSTCEFLPAGVHIKCPISVNTVCSLTRSWMLTNTDPLIPDSCVYVSTFQEFQFSRFLCFIQIQPVRDMTSPLIQFSF